jgi:DNA-binding response OmpR family regulator
VATKVSERPKQGGKTATPMRVLIVEDIPTIAVSMQAMLALAGMNVEIAASGAEALERKQAFKPEVILVDLDLPDMNGIALVERFAGDGDCGLIVVTANDHAAARVAGLDTGADDYIVKPVPARELAARIRAVHRRLNKPPATRQLRVFVDFARRSIAGNDGATTLLTEAESAALETLLDAAGTGVSRDWLSRVALKRPPHADDRAVDQLVMKLRRKLAAHGGSGRIILSARRQGYTIADLSLFRVVTQAPPSAPTVTEPAVTEPTAAEPAPARKAAGPRRAEPAAKASSRRRGM